MFLNKPGFLKVAAHLALALGITALIGGTPTDLLARALGIPYHRVLDRLPMVCVLITVLIFDHHLILPPWSTRTGKRASGPLPQTGVGLLLGAATSLIALIIGLVAGYWGIRTSSISVATLETIAVAITVVPLIEETFFRGLGIPVKKPHPLTIMLVTIVYATVHFWRFPTAIDHEPVTAFSGAQAIWHILLQSSELISIHGLNLLLIGTILATLYLRYSSLWASFAAHATWVLALLILPSQLHPETAIDSSIFTSTALFLGLIWLKLQRV